MSFIQIACAVLVPLLWGYQFVAIKVGVVEFPPLFFLGLRFLAIALLSFHSSEGRHVRSSALSLSSRSSLED